MTANVRVWGADGAKVEDYGTGHRGRDPARGMEAVGCRLMSMPCPPSDLAPSSAGRRMSTVPMPTGPCGSTTSSGGPNRSAPRSAVQFTNEGEGPGALPAPRASHPCEIASSPMRLSLATVGTSGSVASEPRVPPRGIEISPDVESAGLPTPIRRARCRRRRSAPCRFLDHRGPDGRWRHRTGGVGLAHARLSIMNITGAPSRWPTRNDSISMHRRDGKSPVARCVH